MNWSRLKWSGTPNTYLVNDLSKPEKVRTLRGTGVPSQYLSLQPAWSVNLDPSLLSFRASSAQLRRGCHRPWVPPWAGTGTLAPCPPGHLVDGRDGQLRLCRVFVFLLLRTWTGGSFRTSAGWWPRWCPPGSASDVWVVIRLNDLTPGWVLTRLPSCWLTRAKSELFRTFWCIVVALTHGWSLCRPRVTLLMSVALEVENVIVRGINLSRVETGAKACFNPSISERYVNRRLAAVALLAFCRIFSTEHLLLKPLLKLTSRQHHYQSYQYYS